MGPRGKEFLDQGSVLHGSSVKGVYVVEAACVYSSGSMAVIGCETRLRAPLPSLIAAYCRSRVQRQPLISGIVLSVNFGCQFSLQA
jgi:hypothetical protein